MPKPGRIVLMWSLWISTGLSLDLAAWLALRSIPVLAADPPASAAVIALTWINCFVLPPLFAGAGWWPKRLLLGVGIALFAVPIALVIALVSGFFALDIPLMAIIALSPPQDDYVARQATGPVLRGIFNVLEAVMAAAPAAGGAVAVLVASGIAALIPGLSRPRASWRLAAAGAWAATILFLPGWWTPWLNNEWRTPRAVQRFCAATIESDLQQERREIDG